MIVIKNLQSANSGIENQSKTQIRMFQLQNFQRDQQTRALSLSQTPFIYLLPKQTCGVLAGSQSTHSADQVEIGLEPTPNQPNPNYYYFLNHLTCYC